MRFSTSIAVFATLAFGAFTSATPIVVRDDSIPSASCLLTDLQKALTPLAAQLGMFPCKLLHILDSTLTCFHVASIQSNNATSAVIGPIITQVTSSISTAVTAAKALKGQPQAVVLAGTTPGEVVPLQNVAKLVTDILFVRILIYSRRLLATDRL